MLANSLCVKCVYLAQYFQSVLYNLIQMNYVTYINRYTYIGQMSIYCEHTHACILCHS